MSSTDGKPREGCARPAHDEELRLSRRRLAESERRYRDIFEHGLGFICTHDLDGILQSINPAAAAALGIAPAVVPGRSLRSFMPERDRVHFNAYMQRIQEDGEAHGLMPVMTAGGEIRLWRYHNRLLDRGADGAVVLGIAHDVTDHRRMEQQLRDKTAELEAVNDAAPLGLLRTDARGRCTYVNRTWEQLAGITQEQALGDGWRQALHPDDRTEMMAGWARLGTPGNRSIGRMRFVHPDGRTVWCRVHASPIMIEGTVAGYVTTLQDITREHEAESARRRGDRRLATLADALPLLLMFLDRDLRVEFINSGWTRELRRPAAEILGKPVLELLHGPAARCFAEGLEIALGGLEHSEDFDDPNETMIRTWNAVFIPQHDPAGGQVDGIHVMLRDVSLEKAHRQELVRRAEQDPLTSVLNRAGFQVHAQHAWTEAARQGRTLGVFFFDLDGFKEINDALGHAAGDGLLQEISARVRDGVRADDIVARLGGDEFVVVARHVAGGTAAQRLAEKLVAAVQASSQIACATTADALHASCSMGYCVADAADIPLSEALRRADQALYAAKRAGKGRAVRWQAGADPDVSVQR